MSEDMDTMHDDEMDYEEEAPILEDSTPDVDMGAISDDDKLWSFLAYVFTPIIPVIILLTEKKDRPFIKAHNAQALAWGVVNLVGGTILSSVLFFCLGTPSLIIWIVGVYWGWQAYQGQEVTIPFITDFVKQQGWA